MSALPIFLMALAMHPCPGQQAEKAAALYQKVLPSVVTLYSENRSGSSSLGSGFLGVRKGVVVTSWHVVDDAKQVTVRFADGSQTQAKGIVDFSADSDIALLEIAPLDRPRLQVKSGSLPVGSRVFTIGAPNGLEFSISEGLISQHRTIGEVAAYQISCAVSPGNSGGPVLTPEGEVCGIVRARVGNESSLGLAVDAGSVKRLDPAKTLMAFAAIQPKRATDEKVNRALIHIASKTMAELAGSVYRWDYEWDRVMEPPDPSLSLSKQYRAVTNRNLLAFTDAMSRVQALLARLSEDESSSATAVRDFLRGASSIERASAEVSEKQFRSIQIIESYERASFDGFEVQLAKSFEDLIQSRMKLGNACVELLRVFSRETWFDPILFWEELPPSGHLIYVRNTVPGLFPDPDLELGCYVGFGQERSQFVRGDRVSAIRAEGEESFTPIRDWAEFAGFILKRPTVGSITLQVERGGTKVELSIKIKPIKT